METGERICWLLIVSVVGWLAWAKADELGVRMEPQQISETRVEGMIERRNRRRDDGTHPLCIRDLEGLNDLNWFQRQRTVNFGTPRWCDN